uniref:uncharacterized protein LOC122594592 n=1 Tax=Erigeron canadensis TaxID=72917 RepID=UPI001CB99699|nr:uncharacterized protein LOC122594592 [Erigeron canadensis]
MIAPMSQTLDDNDLDDEALWAVIDSAAAVSAAKPQNNHHQSPKISFPLISNSPSPQSTITANPRKQSTVNVEESFTDQRRKKIARVGRSDSIGCPSPPLAMVKHVPRTPTSSSSYCSDYQIQSPVDFKSDDCSVTTQLHSLAGRFPTVDIFKEYQNTAMAILEKGDYTMICGNPFIKKSGWRKISLYFNISYEIKDKTIEFDDNRNVQRAEFIVRAHMQGGRFSDGWGSCDRREKKFSKPNHDIPSTAETRAKNKACQDLLGIGEYRPGLNAQR